MKKFFTLILSAILVVTMFGSISAYAAESTDITVVLTENANATRGNNSTSGIMYGGSTVHNVPLNAGSNPTFSFTISGNSSLYVDVVAIGPLGNEFTVFSNICCNGTTHSSYHSAIIPGTYHFTIRVNHGSSMGQEKPYTISATW